MFYLFKNVMSTTCVFYLFLKCWEIKVYFYDLKTYVVFGLSCYTQLKNEFWKYKFSKLKKYFKREYKQNKMKTSSNSFKSNHYPSYDKAFFTW